MQVNWVVKDRAKRTVRRVFFRKLFIFDKRATSVVRGWSNGRTNAERRGLSGPTKRTTIHRVLTGQVLAFRFVLQIMGKCASRSGSSRDPDCGMVYGGMKRAWSSLKEFPGTESFLFRPSRIDWIAHQESILYQVVFQLLAVQTYTSMVGPGKLAQESKDRLSARSFLHDMC